MTANNHEVWITGVGIVSCFGEGAEHHWKVLGADKAPKPIIDNEIVKPYSVHPLPEMDWSLQIPRRGDQRQMENWQRLGTYTAGLALEDAGMKEIEELVSSMDLVVAAGGGERDVETDNAIMRDAIAANDREKLLLERLPSDLRPTLFLAQLSNLLAGNISIVHKVTGSSRTYMGEETAGITSIENAVSRIKSGQSTHLLVGGSYNADRPDALLPHELGHHLYRGGDAGIHGRQADGGGLRMGSAGAFLVLEEAEHARKRGAKVYAKLTGVASDLGSRDAEKTFTRLDGIVERLGLSDNAPDAVISGATGVRDVTKLEFDYLNEKFGSDIATRAFNTQIGTPLEANLPAGVAFAALAIKNSGFYPQFEKEEKASPSSVNRILVTSLGHVCGEGMAVVETV